MIDTFFMKTCIELIYEDVLCYTALFFYYN